jgi:acyl carrier protein
MDRKTILMDYIKNEIMRNRNARLTEEEDLLSSGILDSLAILQLVAFIDEQFGIEVPDQDVVYENFNSIQSLTGYLAQYSS